MIRPISLLVCILCVANGRFQSRRNAPGDDGIIVRPGEMFKLPIEAQSSQEETIAIGFSTQYKQGILMSISNDDPVNPEYISIEINNNGGVKVSWDSGYGIEEVNTILWNVDLTDGEPHLVNVTRFNQGRKISVQVDDNPALVIDRSYLPGETTTLDNLKSIYFGRNETIRSENGFRGCLFGARFNDIYPMQEFFNSPPGFPHFRVVLEPTVKRWYLDP